MGFKICTSFFRGSDYVWNRESRLHSGPPGWYSASFSYGWWCGSKWPTPPCVTVPLLQVAVRTKSVRTTIG